MPPPHRGLVRFGGYFMPWTAADAAKHVQGLTPKQARAWAAIATSALQRCLKADGTQAACEASAIKQANAVAQKIGEAGIPDAATLMAAYEAAGVSAPELGALLETTTALLTALDEASTTKAAVQQHLKAAADAMRRHQHPVAKMMAKHLDSMRSLLQSGYGGVGSLFDPSAPATESDPPAGNAILAGLLMQEAASILRQDDAYDARRSAVQQALCADPQTRVADADADDSAEQLAPPYPCIVDLFDDVVVYQYGDDLYRRPYQLGTDEELDSITFDAPEPCERAYVPVGEAGLAERQMDKNVGGGTDRDKLPAEDFAGKARSFPIVTPQDVADAAASMGRAGANNYSTDELKRRIIAIAQRKGAAFVAQLPDAWKQAAHESGRAPSAAPAAEAAAAAPTAVALVEAATATDSLVAPLVERAVRADGTARIKLIQAGWGSSGFYPAAVLKRDGPQVFRRGLHLGWDHPTAEEARARPEGSLRNLAGVLESDARWQDAGPAGPGLYADAKFFAPYREAVNELAPHIGMSIRASGRVKEGQAEGRTGALIEELVGAQSVDAVTLPGAGGAILELFEAARQRAYAMPADPPAPPEGSSPVDATEAQALQESVAALREQAQAMERKLAEADARNAELAEALVKRDIARVLVEALATAEVHPMVRERLSRDLKLVAPVEDGALDEAKFRTMIADRLKGELAYISETSGVQPGKIRGLGPSVREEADAAQAEAALAEAFAGFGLSKDAAAVAAAGRR